MRSWILMVALASPVVSQAADSFLCIAEQSTGFALDKAKHSWNATRFKAGEKYVVRRVTENTTAELNGETVRLNSKWAIWRFGDDRHYFRECMKDFDENGLLFCEGIPEFQFSQKNGRFVIGTLYGYVLNGFWVSSSMEDGKFTAKTVVNEPDGSLNPFIEIGTCSAIS